MKRRKFLADLLLTSTSLAISRAFIQWDETDKTPLLLRIDLNRHSPQFDFFSIDSLGDNNLSANIILHDAEWIRDQLILEKKGNKYSYRRGPAKKMGWEVEVQKRSFKLLNEYTEGNDQPFLFNIEQHANHATLLGMMDGDEDAIALPGILHFPDMGSLRVTSNVIGVKVRASAQRFIEHPYVRLEFPAADKDNKKISYFFEVVSIHPEVQGIEGDHRYDCFRKNFISIFQLSPRLKILANNTSSDACAFTLFKYATVAAMTPSLTEDLKANDLIRMTLDRYIGGKKGYGMLGYDYDKEWDIPEGPNSCPSLDSYPSLLMSASIYALSSHDAKWFVDNYKPIKGWADKMLSMDKDNDGLLEFCLSGNSGSWKGDKTQRPANWWDTIGFGHKDAYSNALAYNALIKFYEAIEKFGDKKMADEYKTKAAQLKSAYADTFFNPATGVLAGWKSADGKLHDYYFIFVNTVAISYGLIEDKMANRIMNALLQKMKDVGYTNFELGLPGNLIPVIRKDYTDLLLEVGGGQREDNLDGFQIYENGGATACFTYFTIHALEKLGRFEDADMILLPLLKSMSEGNFQGRGANGRTKDWKTWNGECWGYEGFLVDNYMFLLSVVERSKRKK